MKEYQKLALENVRKNAELKVDESRIYVSQICDKYGLNCEDLIEQVFQNPITINFHPDRLSNNKKLVIENLLEQGQYLGQFLTGTTNGGKSAYIG